MSEGREPTEVMVEAAARVLCQRRGIDPDGIETSKTRLDEPTGVIMWQIYREDARAALIAGIAAALEEGR